MIEHLELGSVLRAARPHRRHAPSEEQQARGRWHEGVPVAREHLGPRRLQPRRRPARAAVGRRHHAPQVTNPCAAAAEPASHDELALPHCGGVLPPWGRLGRLGGRHARPPLLRGCRQLHPQQPRASSGVVSPERAQRAGREELATEEQQRGAAQPGGRVAPGAARRVLRGMQLRPAHQPLSREKPKTRRAPTGRNRTPRYTDSFKDALR